MPTTEIMRYDERVCAVLIQEQLRNQFAKAVSRATPDELFRAAAGALRPRIVNGLLRTAARFRAAESKSLYYTTCRSWVETERRLTCCACFRRDGVKPLSHWHKLEFVQFNTKLKSELSSSRQRAGSADSDGY
jgi:hypothetical protein